MNAFWSRIIEGDVTTFWQVRPDTFFALGRDGAIVLIFDLLFCGFGAVAMTTGLSAGAPPVTMTGINLCLGIGFIAHGVHCSMVAQRYRYYILKNMLMKSDLLHASAKLFPIDICITAGKRMATDPRLTLVFGRSGRGRRNPILRRVPQLWRIDDAEKVFHLMQQIQKETP